MTLIELSFEYSLTFTLFYFAQKDNYLIASINKHLQWNIGQKVDCLTNISFTAIRHNSVMELSQFSLSYLRAKSWNWCVAELTGNCTCVFKFFLNLKNQVWIKSWIYIFENLKQKLFIFALKLNTFISRKWIFLNEKCWHQQTWRRL